MSQEIENNFEERKKDWDLTGLLDDVIRRYIYQLTNDELNEINLEKASGMPDEEIKNGIKLPLATMQQRRETWGSQSKLDVQEPMIFILQSTVEKLSVGDKIPLSDADSFLIHQESGVLNYELHYLMNGTPQEYNAFLDLSKVKVADTLMDGVTHSTPPALSDYLERHQQLNDGLYLTQHQKRYMIPYWRLKNSERTVTSGTGNIREYSKEADRNLRDLQTVQDNKIRTVQDLSSRLDELNQMTDSIRRELRAIQSSREDSETENVISEYLSIQSAFANAAVPIEMEGKFENRLDEIEENYPIEELIHQKESNSKKEKQLQKEIKNLQQASRRLSKLKKIQKR